MQHRGRGRVRKIAKPIVFAVSEKAQREFINRAALAKLGFRAVRTGVTSSHAATAAVNRPQFVRASARL